jgi:hypothetical protein
VRSLEPKVRDHLTQLAERLITQNQQGLARIPQMSQPAVPREQHSTLLLRSPHELGVGGRTPRRSVEAQDP